MKSESITGDHLDLLHLIQKKGTASQRELAQKTSFSLGKVNYCLKALIDIGFVKADNFYKSSKKIKYMNLNTGRH